ncbi:BsuPI-related putative proteinase inhibitor [Natronomonas amylolytica]|uniref:BsuPI-related putative proteinase inhibitor n=1 Tax=Natronomonas amylolytica TaxID=3108498 RepID=UPI003007FD4E
MLESSLEVTVGGGVSFRFVVANGGDSTVELTFRDACKADFAVYEGSEEVWRYSDDRAFAQMLTTAELQPGETATFDAEWPDPNPGDYTAEATLRVVERDVEARTPFSV